MGPLSHRRFAIFTPTHGTEPSRAKRPVNDVHHREHLFILPLPTNNLNANRDALHFRRVVHRLLALEQPIFKEGRTVARPVEPLLRQLILSRVNPRDGDTANGAVDDIVEDGGTSYRG